MIKRIDSIDGIRACASLAVIFNHIYLSFYQHHVAPPRWMDGLSPFGHLGVSLFLLLSGFCISSTYLQTNGREFVLKDFLVRRTVRIMPAYLVCMGVIVTVFALRGSDVSGLDILAHLTLTHNFFSDYSTSLGPYWTVALEMQLYIIFACSMVVSRYVRRRFLLYMGVGVWVIWRTWMYVKLGSHYTELTFSFTYAAFGRLIEFLLGVITARYWSSQKLQSLIETHEKPLLGLGAMLVCTWGLISAKIGPTNPLGDLILCAGIFILFNVALQRESFLYKLLSVAWLTTIGEGTYSIYLYHCLVIRTVGDIALARLPTSLSGLYLVLVSGLSIVGGYVLYLLVEKRIMSFARVGVMVKAITNSNVVTTPMS